MSDLTSEHDDAPRESSGVPSKASQPIDRAEELGLVKRSQAGDMAAYDELIRRYQERIYGTLYHMTSNHEDAHDLAQESFIKAYQAIKTFKGGSSFYTWLYRIAVNKTLNHLKSRKNKVHLSLNDLDFNAENDPDLVALVSDKTPQRDAGLKELQKKIERSHATAVRTSQNGGDVA